MKRITVQITLSDDYRAASIARYIKSAMITAAVAKVTEENGELYAIDTKIGNVRKR